MTHQEQKKIEEKIALEILFKELQIKDYIQSESPDTHICYDGKQIGVEVTGYHRDEDNKAADAALDNSLKKYEALINERGDRGKEISVLIDDEQAIYYTSEKEESTLFEAIDHKLNGKDVFNPYVMDVVIRQLLPNEECVILRDGVASCEEVEIDLLNKLIAKKENKLQGYKKRPQNSSLEEYWLLIHINCYEYDYFEKTPFQLTKETAYNRIYLTHLVDGVLRIK